MENYLIGYTNHHGAAIKHSADFKDLNAAKHYFLEMLLDGCAVVSSLAFDANGAIIADSGNDDLKAVELGVCLASQEALLTIVNPAPYELSAIEHNSRIIAALLAQGVKPCAVAQKRARRFYQADIELEHLGAIEQMADLLAHDPAPCAFSSDAAYKAALESWQVEYDALRLVRNELSRRLQSFA